MTLVESFYGWLSNYMPAWGAYIIAALAGILLMITFVLIMVMAFIYFERRGLGRFQIRLGPNRTGPFGLLQPVADALKVLLKEDIIPSKGDKLVFIIAPMIVFLPVLLIFGVIPVQGNAIFVDLNIGILYIFSISGFAVIGAFMAGWASNNKYALIGAIRSVSQMIAYEVPVVLSVLGVVLLSGSLSTVAIVEAQKVPFILLQPLGFLLFFTASLAEINRAPFDLLEADSEIVAGYHIEYSGMKFAMFFLAEYGHALIFSAMITTLFLSGWKGPFLPPIIWFLIKTFFVFWLVIWVRATLPRMRVDQLSAFAWKGLLPLSLINIFITALELTLLPTFPSWLILVNLVICGLLILIWSKFYNLERRPVEI